MNRKLIFLALLIIALVFGMTVVGCDDDSTNDNGNDNGNGNGKKEDKTIIWTEVADSTFGSKNITSIVYGAGKFVAGGRDGKMAYSTDGISWTAINSPFSTNNYSLAVTYGNGKFVAIGSTVGGKDMVTNSTDGIVWTEAKSNTALNNTNTYDIAYGGGKFVTGRNNMAYSSDGQNWTAANTDQYSSYTINTDYGSTFTLSQYLILKSITYGNGKFVAGGNRGDAKGQIVYSTNGENWIPVSHNTTIPMFDCIVYGGGKFVASRDSRDSKIFYSTDDGITWNESNYTDSGGLAYGGGKFVSSTAYSIDGITWIEIAKPILASIIAYGGSVGSGRFIAGISGRIYYSNVQD